MTLHTGRQALLRAATRLRPLINDVVFFGGQVTELLVTDPGAAGPRTTEDVDVITDVPTVVQYDRTALALRAIGLTADPSRVYPFRRWRSTDGLALDVLPGLAALDRAAWHSTAIDTAQWHHLRSDLRIRVVSAPVWLATKWAAFDVRGGGDPCASHDVEDIVTVVAGRASLAHEVALSAAPLRDWLVARTRQFLAERDAVSAIAGALPDARFDSELLDRAERRFADIAR